MFVLSSASPFTLSTAIVPTFKILSSPRSKPSATRVPVTVAPVEVVSNLVLLLCLILTEPLAVPFKYSFDPSAVLNTRSSACIFKLPVPPSVI